MNWQRERHDGWLLQQLNQRLSDYVRLYGYEAIELPIIESADLFLVKAGDQIVNKLFTFEHHGQQLALRPEFTAPAAYHYLLHQNGQRSIPSISRLQFSGYIFEYDSHSLQNRQRFSIGAECLGNRQMMADAEIISLASAGMSVVGVDDWQLILGHVGLIKQLLVKFNLDAHTEHFLLGYLPALQDSNLGKAFVTQQMEKLLLGNTNDESTERVVEHYTSDITRDLSAGQQTMFSSRTSEDISRRLVQKRKRFVERSSIEAAIDLLSELGTITASPREAFREISRLVPFDDTYANHILTEWSNVVNLVKEYGIGTEKMRVQPALARSWDYYTGTVFELQTQLGEHLGGGGRYDGLTRLLGSDHEIPAVGFAYYVDNLIKVLPKVDQIPVPMSLYYDANISSISAVTWSKVLREKSIPVQLLPVSHLEQPQSENVLNLNADSSIDFAGNNFTVANAASLIAAINHKMERN